MFNHLGVLPQGTFAESETSKKKLNQIMNKIILNVPEDLKDNKLSNWEGFENYLPEGHIILNKKITGCGATTYYLKNDTPVILCCHRLQLLDCKFNDDNLQNNPETSMFYYRSTLDWKENPGKRDKEKAKKEALDMMKNLKLFLLDCNNPFTPKTPKILVTTDSLGKVISVLKETGELDKFTVVSDECQCIVSDSQFKLDSTLNYLQYLEDVKNVIFLTATTFEDVVYEAIDEFKDLPIVELVWKNEIQVAPKQVYVTSIYTQIHKIINDFKKNGYFEYKKEGVKDYYSTEACFFLNSVKDILKVCKKEGLNPEEVNIICSKSKESELQKAGYSLGFSPKYGDAHKTYTFITKCAFEGVDFYSTNAMTYIFSNPNLGCEAADIQTDIPQIMGRQRRKDNKFRFDAILYFQRKSKPETREEFEERENKKDSKSENLIETLNNLYNIDPEGAIDLYKSYKGDFMFCKDYVSFNSKDHVFTFNKLAKVQEIICWKNQNETYNQKSYILENEETTEEVKVDDIEKIFLENSDFATCMKVYCEVLEENPELKETLEASTFIPKDIKDIYNKVGGKTIKSRRYNVTDVMEKVRTADSSDKIKSAIILEFHEGDKLSNKEIKSKLSKIYKDLGLTYNAKASDIEKYFETKRNRTRVDGKQIEGLELIKIK